MFNPYFNPNLYFHFKTQKFNYQNQTLIENQIPPAQNSFKYFQKEQSRTLFHQIAQQTGSEHVKYPAFEQTNKEENNIQKSSRDEFLRQETFYENPVCGSSLFCNRLEALIAENYYKSLNQKQNPEKTQTISKIQSNFQTQIQDQLQAETAELLHETPSQQAKDKQESKQQDVRIRLSNEKPVFQEPELLAQTQKLFEIFENEQFQQEIKINSIITSSVYPQAIPQIIDQSFAPITKPSQKIQQIQELQTISSKKSYLKSIKTKIQLQKLSSPFKLSKFNLKQFNQILKKIPSNLQKSASFNRQISDFDKNFKQNSLINQQEQQKFSCQINNFIKKFQLSIMPHFQKLEKKCEEKLMQVNQGIEKIMNLYKQNDQKQNIVTRQSLIKISLSGENQEKSKQTKIFERSRNGVLSNFEVKIKELQASEVLDKPRIHRTDSSEHVYISPCPKKQAQSIFSLIDSRIEYEIEDCNDRLKS